MNNKVWVYKNIDNSITRELMNKYGFSEICASVLQNRTEIVGGNVDNLFKRVLYNLHNPYLLNDMDLAVVRIEKAIIRGEKITVYGDYDADGVTSTSLLYMFLKDNGADVDFYIPNRFDDGYGISTEVLDKLHADGTNLVITVDNGITAAEEIEYAKSIGVDVIVTDHHKCPEIIPDCCAVINPKRADSTYPFSELAGVGVVFKLICALNKGTLESVIKKYILLVAIGTIADVVPLNDENRAIVTMGLKMIPLNTNVGIKALIDVCGIENLSTVSDVAFGLVPRINAAGRLDDASKCVRMFVNPIYDDCFRIATELNALNIKRQDIERAITEEAFEIINTEKLYRDDVIVVYNEGWNHGVIGIVASKICEKYYKPCIVLTDDNGIVKGSGRSVGDFDLYNSLSACADLLERFGGHCLAAGLSLEADKVDLFRKKINNYAEEFLNGNTFAQKIYIDYDLSADMVTMENIKSLDVLEPYGVGNPKPVFSLKNVTVREITSLSEGRHIKLKIRASKYEIEVLGFNMGEYFGLLAENDTIDIAGCLDINSYRGFDKAQIILKDIKRIKHI